MIRPIPQAAIDLIKKFEGFKPTPYYCPGGILTIGYGTTFNVKLSDHVTEQQAELLLCNILQDIQPDIIKACKITLNNNQLSALLSFTYNVGMNDFLSSTLLKVINNGNISVDVVRQFKRWVYAKDIELPGLIARRLAESTLYLT